MLLDLTVLLWSERPRLGEEAEVLEVDLPVVVRDRGELDALGDLRL